VSASQTNSPLSQPTCPHFTTSTPNPTTHGSWLGAGTGREKQFVIV